MAIKETIQDLNRNYPKLNLPIVDYSTMDIETVSAYLKKFRNLRNQADDELYRRKFASERYKPRFKPDLSLNQLKVYYKVMIVQYNAVNDVYYKRYLKKHGGE